MSQSSASAASEASISGDSAVTYNAGPPPWLWLVLAAAVLGGAWFLFRKK